MFSKYIHQMKPLLVKTNGAGGPVEDKSDFSVRLYHPSLAEWFTSTKFCGPVFACSVKDGSALIAQWRKSKSGGDIYDQPDLVVGLESSIDENAEMWMLLDT